MGDSAAAASYLAASASCFAPGTLKLRVFL